MGILLFGPAIDLFVLVNNQKKIKNEKIIMYNDGCCIALMG